MVRGRVRVNGKHQGYVCYGFQFANPNPDSTLKGLTCGINTCFFFRLSSTQLDSSLSPLQLFPSSVLSPIVSVNSTVLRRGMVRVRVSVRAAHCRSEGSAGLKLGLAIVAFECSDTYRSHKQRRLTRVRVEVGPGVGVGLEMRLRRLLKALG